MAGSVKLPSLCFIQDLVPPGLSLIRLAGSVTKLMEERFDHFPALVQYLGGREGEGVPPPEDDVQGPHEGEDGGEVEQQVVVQEQHLHDHHEI